MGKRFWSLALSTALIAGVFTVLPAQAQEAPAITVPEVVNIEDPKGDANYLNDQGGQCVGSPLPPTCTPFFGDNVGTDQFGTVSDILKVWFTADATTVSAHILTNAAPPASTPVFYRVRVDPGTGSNCLWFQAYFPGVVQGQSDPVNKVGAQLRDTCATALGTQALDPPVVSVVGDDGVVTITASREMYPAFVDGGVLKTPSAETRNHSGPGAPAVTAPQVDNTKQGTDYTITSGGPGPVVTDPGKPSKPKPTTPKGCDKGKGKKKGCGKPKPDKPGKPKPPATPEAPKCAAYVPGEAGTGAATSVVTADFTADKPLEVAITAPSTADDSISVFHNIQIGAVPADVGLFARYEFPIEEDHDIYLDYADGSEAAHAGGFNPAPFVPNNPVFWTDGTGAGGHSEQGAEQIDGIKSAGCAGYTLDMQSFLSPGGDMTLKLWLGPVENEPAAPGALARFYSLLGL